MIFLPLFLDSSMVEHSAVNRGVVGSSPIRGVFFFKRKLTVYFRCAKIHTIWLRGQEVKTSPFHGGNTGPIPVGVIFTE